MSTFFRFPLWALSAFETPKERLDKLVGYCVIAVGSKQIEDANEVYKTEDAWKHGCKLLNVTWTGKNAHKDALREFQTIALECTGKNKATVSISTSFFWNCVCGLRGTAADKPLSYREFSVLCAVLSKIGDKEFASCSWREIQRRALGYASAADMAAHLGKRADQASPLSRQQIRDTLDDLNRCRFFARFSVGNGKRSFLTYFSVRMQLADLAAAATKDFAQRRRRKVPQSAGIKAMQASLWQQNRHARRTNHDTTTGASDFAHTLPAPSPRYSPPREPH